MLKIKRFIMHNFWLKLLSLVFAVVTWFYVTWQLGRVRREEEKAIFSMIHYDVVLRELPVDLIIVGKPKEGYIIKESGITVEPKECIIVGPKNILGDVKTAKTVPIDISGYSKDIDRRVALAPIAGGITSEDEFIKIHIPIIKKNEPVKPQGAQ
ncbi:MAG: YbbR-like domain-containing protein [Candidatus Omnitrophica bacterium]|nr:YbbR-like domain-containing protein [Candidatus Omnitrophota bacterium]MBU4487574.1 YbbR-like domain-containing protein [Candidatus Omnitrophota bacterium]MCG2705590.1 YbbR-like domain-containing protein [Candidatus Omnitrophota bacterium]